MLLCFFGGCFALQHLFDQVNTASWAIELIAEQLVGWTGGRAKATMHTFAQNGLAQLTLGAEQKLGGKLGLHKIRIMAPSGGWSWVCSPGVKNTLRIEGALKLILQVHRIGLDKGVECFELGVLLKASTRTPQIHRSPKR